MARRSPTARAAELAFDAISIEGGLLAADWLSRVAQLKAPQQDPADYGVPKGIELRDEIGRSWRIAQAYWAEFEAGRKAKADPEALSRRFVLALLREALASRPRGARGRALVTSTSALPAHRFDGGGRVPVVTVAAPRAIQQRQERSRRREAAVRRRHSKRSAFGLAQEYLNAAKARCGASRATGSRCASCATTRASPARRGSRPTSSGSSPRSATPTSPRSGCSPTTLASGGPISLLPSCALETWRNAGREQGTRAREKLRRGRGGAARARSGLPRPPR
jgi:hypothetical protein